MKSIMYTLKILKFVSLLVYLSYARPRRINSHRTKSSPHDNANFEIFLNQHPNLKHHHLISQKEQVLHPFDDLGKKKNSD